MKEEDIHKKAKKKVEAKKAFYITAFIFGGVSAILVTLSLIIRLEFRVVIWLLFPMVIFAVVLLIMYFSIFGIPGTGLLSEDWEEEEMNREVFRLYREKGIQIPEEDALSEEDRLELKELERLKEKWERRDDYV